MENEPAGKVSIEAREKIVLPLLTIQQYALKQVRELEGTKQPELLAMHERVVTRSLYCSINASRNSA
jgi:phosphoenolpyruvate carboxylase